MAALSLAMFVIAMVIPDVLAGSPVLIALSIVALASAGLSRFHPDKTEEDVEDPLEQEAVRQIAPLRDRFLEDGNLEAFENAIDPILRQRYGMLVNIIGEPVQKPKTTVEYLVEDLQMYGLIGAPPHYISNHRVFGKDCDCDCTPEERAACVASPFWKPEMVTRRY